MSLHVTDGSLQMPVMPSGTEIASYCIHAEARAAADFPSDEKLDVRPITIVGTDLHPVERVTGRLTMAGAALSGASSDALWGAFVGLVMSFTLMNQSVPLWVLFGITGGTLAGAFTLGLLYTMTGGHRDLTSQSQVVASHHAVLVSMGIDQALELLQRGPGNQMRPHPARRRPESEGPSEHGSRPDEKPRFDVRLSDEGEDGRAEVPRDNGYAAPTQKPAETVVEPAEDSRKPLDRERARGALDRGSGEGEPLGVVQGLDSGESIAQCIQPDPEVIT